MATKNRPLTESAGGAKPRAKAKPAAKKPAARKTAPKPKPAAGT